MDAAQKPAADTAEYLTAHLLAVRSVLDALIASHPDPGAFLAAHDMQLEKLRVMQERAGRPIGLQQALSMHDLYSRKVQR